MARKYGLFINGQYVHSENWQRVPQSLNPEDSIAEFSYFDESDDPDLREACLEGAAQTHEQILQGFFPLKERVEFLIKLKKRIHEQGENLARLIMQEVGKPIDLARGEVARSLQTIDATLEATSKTLKKHPIPSGDPNKDWNVEWEYLPRGPLLAITPFNFPLNLLMHKLAPAIAAGCPVVVKPSDKAVMTALCLADYCHAEELPPGMLNVFACSNSEVSKLIEDERIQQISFTGSAKVGWELKSKTSKPFTLELGGAAPCYVAEDADLSEAADALAKSAFAYSGQVCISAQSIHIDESVYQSFLAEFKKASAKIAIGSPAHEGSVLGPVINSSSKKRIEKLKNELAQQATLTEITDGRKIKTQNINEILFSKSGWEENVVHPAIIEGLDRSHSFYREECFAPLVSLCKSLSFDDFVAFANKLPSRLQCSLWSKSKQVEASRLRYGGVVLNGPPSLRFDPMPYGGMGKAGSGREGPEFAIAEFCEIRTLLVDS